MVGRSRRSKRDSRGQVVAATSVTFNPVLHLFPQMLKDVRISSSMAKSSSSSSRSSDGTRASNARKFEDAVIAHWPTLVKSQKRSGSRSARRSVRVTATDALDAFTGVSASASATTKRGGSAGVATSFLGRMSGKRQSSPKAKSKSSDFADADYSDEDDAERGTFVPFHISETAVW